MKRMSKYLFILIALLTLSSTASAQVMEGMSNQERARVVHSLISRMRPIPQKDKFTGKIVYRQVITPSPITNFEWWAVMGEKLYKDKSQASLPAIVKSAHNMTNLLTYEKKRNMVFIVANADMIKQARQSAGLQGGVNSKGTGKNEEFFIVTFYDEWKKYMGKK